jgi:hypothetical protein
MAGRFPLLVLSNVPHLLPICESCPSSELRPNCTWTQCKHFSSKERYWDSICASNCPENRFDVFKDNT